MLKTKRAFFITGFNNWGKTTILRQLFGARNFNRTSPHFLPATRLEFIIQGNSNDDIASDRFRDDLIGKRELAINFDCNLISAFCPTRDITPHSDNNSLRILNESIIGHFDEIHIILLEYKWDNHAKLLTEEIITFYESIPNIKFISINQGYNLSTPDERIHSYVLQIREYILSL